MQSKTSSVKLKHPWMTIGLHKSSKTKNKMYKMTLQGVCSYDTYKAYRNKFNSLVRTAKVTYFINYINNHRLDTRALWGLINNFVSGQFQRKINARIGIQINNIDKLNEYFANLGSDTTKHLPFSKNFRKHLRNPAQNSVFLSPVTEEEIIKIGLAMPMKYSSGHDNISAKLIKLTINTISKPLCLIFNKSFLLGQVPVSLKIAKICPIYKSGDKSDRSNYRPISVLKGFSKIL
jgi:hypothetical protein